MQIQCQLFSSNRIYCDFILWTKKEIHIERIFPDDEFWHSKVVDHAQPFFMRAILPELLGKFYSKTNSLSLPTTPVEDNPSLEETYCYCNGPEEGLMVGCDNPVCKGFTLIA